MSSTMIAVCLGLILTQGSEAQTNTGAIVGTMTKIEISDAERRRVLVEELGISEEIAEALPPRRAGRCGVVVIRCKRKQHLTTYTTTLASKTCYGGCLSGG